MEKLNKLLKKYNIEIVCNNCQTRGKKIKKIESLNNEPKVSIIAPVAS